MSGLDHVRDAVSGLLTEVSMHFKGRPKITLLVRHPDLEAAGKDADFVMTDDNLEDAIASLQRRIASATLPNTQEGRG